MYGASDAPRIAAVLKARELPVYRTAVGKSSDNTVPSGPKVTPVNANPMIIKMRIPTNHPQLSWTPQPGVSFANLRVAGSMAKRNHIWMRKPTSGFVMDAPDSTPCVGGQLGLLAPLPP
jgi:hypothetical protein